MTIRNIKIISGNSNPLLARHICDFLRISLSDVTVGVFPDGESMVRINDDITGEDVYVVQSCDHPANQNYMELFVILDAVRRASAGRITAVLPFFGYARQDKVDAPGAPVSARLIADLLVTAGADRALTVDLHSQQVAGFFTIPIEHLSAEELFLEHLHVHPLENTMVCSPDIGGLNMAGQYADAMCCDLGVVLKHRIDYDHVRASKVIGEVAGRNILLVDDMTVTFNTLDAAAKLLKQNGARGIHAMVSHCLLTDEGYSRLLQSDIDELVTTNSTGRSNRFINHPKVMILNIGNLLGSAIAQMHSM